MAHQILPYTGAQFNRGEVFISSADSTGKQFVPLGLVQDFSYKDSIGLKEIRGPRSRMPVAVSQSDSSIDGSCKFAATNAQILDVLRGATLSAANRTTTAGTVTTTQTRTLATRKGSDNIKPCMVELFDVDNEGGPHIVFLNVIFTDLNNPQPMEDYTVWDATFKAYPEVTTGVVYLAYYPGAQTVAYTLPSGYTADTAIATAQTNYAAVVAATGAVD